MALLEVEGQSFEAGWAVDIMILRSHRGAGLGKRLHETVTREVDILLALTMADGSRRLAEREGCITFGEVHQLTRWVRLDAESVRQYLLVRAASHGWVGVGARLCCSVLQIHRLVPLLANPMLRLRDSVRRPRYRPTATTIVEVDRFGPEIDDLWGRTRSDYPVIVSRDTRYLNWRFVDCPDLTYRRFVARRGDQAVGYVVLRHAESVELQQGIIAELYAAADDVGTVEELVRHSLAFFGNTVLAVDCGTSVPGFQTVLRNYGFVRTRAHRPTCVCRDEMLRSRLHELRNDWFLTKGDQDWDQIHVFDPAAAVD